jgi:hypothetical protein
MGLGLTLSDNLLRKARRLTDRKPEGYLVEHENPNPKVVTLTTKKWLEDIAKPALQSVKEPEG